jgi:hypothetical protein
VFLDPLADLLDQVSRHMDGEGLALALEGQTPGGMFVAVGAKIAGVSAAHVATAHPDGHQRVHLP